MTSPSPGSDCRVFTAADLRRLQERRRWKRGDPHTPSAAPSRMPHRRPTSPPELLDSTSNLLSALHLNGMSQTGSDQVLEVPDSPDRPARINREADLVPEVPDSPEQSPSGWRNPRRSRRAEDSDIILVGGGSSSAGNDAERMRKQAGLKRLISNALDTKASPESPCRKIAKTVDQSRAIHISSDSQSRGSWRGNRSQRGESGNDVERRHRDEGKEVDLITGARDNMFPTMGQSCLGINGGLSRCNRGENIVQSEVDGRNDLELLGGDTSSSLAGISDQYVSRHYAAKNNAGNTSGECVGEDLPDRISIASSEAVDRNKGKLKMDENTTQSRPRVQARAHPDRKSWRFDMDVTVISDEDEDSTTTNHTRRARSCPSDDVFKREDTNNLVHDGAELVVSHNDLNTSTSRVPSESELAWRRHLSWQKLSEGRDRYNSLRSISGGSSSSVFRDPDTLNPQSGQGLNSGTTLDFHDRGTVSGPVIDLDEEHPPERFGSSQEQNFADYYSRQVESDEIFARQLQEQFYRESSGRGGTTETDVTIAWSLQEEDARRPGPITRSQSQLRNATMAHLYRDYSRSSLQRACAEARACAQVAHLAQAPTSELQAQFRRVMNDSEMDLGTRLEFLEVFGDVYDDSDFNFQAEREFNGDDYERLLALDERNHEHVGGATEFQIDNLPYSVIQMSGISEACVICLDPPSVGDVVRHLPCLHKFHKECIDTWLRQKAKCPICKSDIG